MVIHPSRYKLAGVSLASSHLVHRCQDGIKPLLQFSAPGRPGMREHVELVLADCSNHLCSDIGRIDPGLNAFGDLNSSRAHRACGIHRVWWTVALRSIALALDDPSPHKTWTEHRHANAKRLELSRERLRHGDHGEFACPIGRKPRSAQHTGHGCGVNYVAAFAVCSNVWNEGANPVNHSHDIDVEYPSPTVE